MSFIKIFSGILSVLFVVFGAWLVVKPERVVAEEVLLFTYTTAKEYGALRYRTDQVLARARTYESYASWSADAQRILSDWNSFLETAETLERYGESLSSQSMSFTIIQRAYAYDKQEISQIFDQAPAGKKIATLAKHLGVDAKRAMKILEQDQAQVTADAWNDAGDTMQKLETSAVVIKDTAKVSLFVGTVVVTGGAAGFASGSVVGQASVLVSGADLILEVTDDAAKIGIGNHNGISAIASDARKVTEPLAGLLAVADIPKNVTKGIEKLSAVTFGAEQLNSVAQEGKIIGIELPAHKKTEKFQNIKKYNAPVYISSLDSKEATSWVKAQEGGGAYNDTEESVARVLLDEDVQIDRTGDVTAPALEQNGKEIQGSDSALGAIDTLTETLVLTPKMELPGNDWQGAMRIMLFSHALIEIENGTFDVKYRAPYEGGGFSGVGDIHLTGTYDQSTGTLRGTHRRTYDGVYKGEKRTITYSGAFSHVIPKDAEEMKIQFLGSIETTRTDTKGKSYSTKSEGGSSQIYTVRRK